MKAVILYGPPGGGKGTQANLLSRLSGFVHFDTGQYIEELLLDPISEKDLILVREKKLFDEGKLCTPSWVLDIVKKKVAVFHKAGLNVVFSGSPRTLYEAFGDDATEGLIPFLGRLYKQEGIFIFVLKVRPETTLARNSSRFVCSLCGQPILYSGIELSQCPFCGSVLRKRSLDKPEIIKERLIEYANRTEPIFTKLKEGNYDIYEINGEPMPQVVFNEIRAYLDIVAKENK